jgi:hypothetical protein
MSFNNCAEVQVILGEHLFDSVDISLRINDQGGFAVVGDVSTISESGRIEYDYIEWHFVLQFSLILAYPRGYTTSARL